MMGFRDKDLLSLLYLRQSGRAVPGAIEDAHRAQRRSRQHVGQGSWTSLLTSQLVVWREIGGCEMRAGPSNKSNGLKKCSVLEAIGNAYSLLDSNSQLWIRLRARD
jgi:hypothetical protein